MAKTFFFVCAGLALLISSLGRTMQARAQGSSIEVGSVDGQYYVFAGASGRTIYAALAHNIPGPIGTVKVLPPVPGTSKIVSVNFGHNAMEYVVLLENGDCYGIVGDEWILMGNLLGGGPTPARSETWGSTKARYR